MNAVGKLAVFGLAIVCTAGAAADARAQSFHHIDELAMRLEGQTARLAADLRYHYRHTRQFRHLYHDVVEMNRLARHIHDMVHQADCLDHIRADVAELDELFHHVEDLVADMGGPGYRGHGPYGYHGHGYHGSRRLWNGWRRSATRCTTWPTTWVAAR
jgi:hypothetical protein